MSRFSQLVCVLLIVVGAAAPVRAEDASVSVVDFYNLSQDKQWDWLGRGLADMLITDLAAVGHFRVVDREGLQTYLDELELQSSGILSDESLVDIGRLAGIDKVVFGTYEVDRNDIITVQATIVDIASQRPEAAAKLSGASKDFLDLEKDLAARLVSKFGVSLSAEEEENLKFSWTESLDATSHFYTALGHYERGALPLALAEAKVAEKIDANYLPARFWSGRIYVELAEYEHAELYLTTLLRDANARVFKPAYIMHASLLLAQLYEKFLETPEKAIPVLEAMRSEKVDSFERANVHFQLASLYRQTGRYADAYHLFVALYRNDAEPILTSQFQIPYRSVALFPSMQRLRKMAIENYQSCFLLAFHNTDEALELQPEMVMLSEEQAEYSKSETFQGSFSYAPDVPRPMFIAPKGQRFSEFTIEFRGTQEEVHIFPYIHLNKRFDQIAQMDSLPAPENSFSQFRYRAQQIRVQAFFFHAYVRSRTEGRFSWRVKAEFVQADAFQPGSIEYWHDLLKKNVRYPLLFDTPGHQGEKTTILEGHDGEFWIVYDTHNDEEQNDRGKDSDLWLIASPDKVSWRDPRRLVALNSVANDFDPVLIHDGRNRLVLTFASDRNGKNELWLAMSNDGDRWQRPRRIVLRNNGNELSDLITPVVFQDRKGIYRLAAFHTVTQRVVVSSSKDLLNWEAAAFIELAEMHPDGGWGEKVTLDYIEDNAGIYRMVVSGNFFFGTKIHLGTSRNARNWQFRKAEFESYSHPSLIQARDGRFLLTLASGVDDTVSKYPMHYMSQVTSRNYDTWSPSAIFPRIHYLTDHHMKPSTIFQDIEGHYWIANHRHWQEQFQLYRVPEFPATTIAEIYPPKPDAHPYALIQLRREDLVLKARKAGDNGLATCLRKARHYESCLDEQSVNAEREWWKFW